MSIKCLYFFKDITEISSLINILDEMNWKIEKEYLKDRVNFYNKTELFRKLKSDFLLKKN